MDEGGGGRWQRQAVTVGKDEVVALGWVRAVRDWGCKRKKKRAMGFCRRERWVGDFLVREKLRKQKLKE